MRSRCVFMFSSAEAIGSGEGGGVRLSFAEARELKPKDGEW